MKIFSRTRALGGSLIVTLPKEIIKEESIEEGELVEIDLRKIKKSGFGILKGKLGKFSEKDELNPEI